MVRLQVLPRLTRRRLLLYALVLLALFLVLPMPRRSAGGGGSRLRDGLAVLLGGLPSFSRGAASGTSAQGFDVIRYIDPLIGTTNGGHVFPGASLPYGMAKPVADSDSYGENAAGFVSDDHEIIGFSHMHDSGTGGSPSLGNFPLFVHPGCPDDDYRKCNYVVSKRVVAKVKNSVEARAGYFALNMTNSVRAEMTATEHTALYRFSFPGTKYVNDDGVLVPYAPLILMDMIDLGNSRSDGDVQVFNETGRITSNATYNPSFGKGKYTAFACVDFSGAALRSTGTFMDEEAMVEPKEQSGVGAGFAYPSGSAGAWVHFDPPPNNQILARVGLSFISKERACQSAQREIPGWNFDETVAAAQQVWREKLSVIEYEGTGVSEDMQTVFWSGIYRSMLSPQDYTGENPKWSSQEPYFDSFYCIWDSFRAQHPLLTILDPPAQAKMVRALLDIFRNEGKLPDCRMSFCKGFTQGGSNADVVLVDAFVKNISEGISWPTAYAALLSDAEEEPEDWSVEGRGNLVSYHKMGYIPWNDEDRNGTGPASRTISRTLEYAYDDYCISTLARTLGDAQDADKYLTRSAFWRNMWNPEQKDMVRDGRGYYVQSAFTGFMQPRLLNGSFRFQSPRLCSPVHEQHLCYFDTAYDTYEGSPWLYTFYVPQDMAGLIATLGGAARFVERLDFFHESGIVYMGNEQSFLPVFQFHYGARPGRSSYWAHRYVPSMFNHSINGIPGNDDCAMGAFTAFVYMGFFPVAGQDVYLIIPPFFPEVRVKARNGKFAVVRNINFDPTGRENIYVQSATLNGRPLTRSWITHDFFMTGGLLELTLGKEEGKWGTDPSDLPPSSSTAPDERTRAIANGTMKVEAIPEPETHYPPQWYADLKSAAMEADVISSTVVDDPTAPTPAATATATAAAAAMVVGPNAPAAPPEQGFVRQDVGGGTGSTVVDGAEQQQQRPHQPAASPDMSSGTGWGVGADGVFKNASSKSAAGSKSPGGHDELRQP